MQIEGKDNSRQGTKIKERTAAFIAGPYNSYGTIFEATCMFFEADFWA